MKKTDDLSFRVYEFLTTIPRGKVVTYGQVAEFLGNKNLARAVGNILHKNPAPEKYPCYKVVNAGGKPAEHFGDGGISVQRQRLEKEGITVCGNRVNLQIYQWKDE